MHEMSVALEVARIAEEKLGDRLRQLVSIGVDVGDNAGVERSSLEFCLEAVFATPPFRNVTSKVIPCDGETLTVAYLEIDDGC